jgi:hypothetical protein
MGKLSLISTKVSELVMSHVFVAPYAEKSNHRTEPTLFGTNKGVVYIYKSGKGWKRLKMIEVR